MSVIDFQAAKQERQPHYSGLMACVGCRHEWQAVAPMGQLWLDCPSCGLPKGHPKHPFGGDEGDIMLICTDCGGEALTAYIRNGVTNVLCMGCGSNLTEAFYE